MFAVLTRPFGRKLLVQVRDVGSCDEFVHSASGGCPTLDPETMFALIEWQLCVKATSNIRRSRGKEDIRWPPYELQLGARCAQSILGIRY